MLSRALSSSPFIFSSPSPSSGMDPVPGTVLGAVGSTVPGADLSFCLHKSPVSGVRPMGSQKTTAWYSAFPERARGAQGLWCWKDPGERLRGQSRRLQASFPSSSSFSLPLSFPHFFPFFGDYFEYLSQLKLWFQ